MEQATRNYKIYVHVNKLNGKIYIGQTRNLEHRYGTNGKGYEKCSSFWKAIEKYGWDNFNHIILMEDLTQEEADIIERELISKYRSTNPEFGYNGSPGNGGKLTEKNRNMLTNDVNEKFPRGITKKSYTVTVDEDIVVAFKDVCKEQNINQSMLIEAFMRTYTNQRIKLELVNNKTEVQVKE